MANSRAAARYWPASHAATRSVAVPFPAAADNHQLSNAQAFSLTGAARLIGQKNARPEELAALVTVLMEDTAAREKISGALAQWHAPQSAAEIASAVYKLAIAPQTAAGKGAAPAAPRQTRVPGVAALMVFAGLNILSLFR